MGSDFRLSTSKATEMGWPWLGGFVVVCGVVLTLAASMDTDAPLFREDGPVEWVTLGMSALAGFGFVAAATRGAGRGWAVVGGLCLIGALDEFGWGTRHINLTQPGVLGEQLDGLHDVVQLVKRVYLNYRLSARTMWIFLALGVGVACALATAWLVRHPAQWAAARRSAPIWLVVMAVGLVGLAQSFDSGLFYTAYFRQEPLPPLAAWVRSLPIMPVEESMELLAGLGLALAVGLLLWQTWHRPHET